MTELIVSQFGILTHMGPRNHVLKGVQISQLVGALFVRGVPAHYNVWICGVAVA